MDIVILNTSETPIYQQIYDQLSAQILKGELEGDYCLPPIRTVAKELRVSVITVKRAWEELERAGLIYSMVGRGCFVATLQNKERSQKKKRLVEEKLEKDIAYYKSLGVSKEELVTLIEKYFK